MLRHPTGRITRWCLVAQVGYAIFMGCREPIYALMVIAIESANADDIDRLVELEAKLFGEAQRSTAHLST